MPRGSQGAARHLLITVYLRVIGAPQQIVYTDVIEVGQLDQPFCGQFNNAVFILRVGVLGYVEDTGKIALTKIVIFP